MLQNTVYVPSNHFDNLYLVSPLIRLVTFHSPQIYLEMCLQYSWDFTCIENSPSKRFMSTLLAQNVFLISSSPMNLQNSIAIARHDQKNTLLQKCMYTPAFHLKRRRICTQITMHSDGGGGGGGGNAHGIPVVDLLLGQMLGWRQTPPQKSFLSY